MKKSCNTQNRKLYIYEKNLIKYLKKSRNMIEQVGFFIKLLLQIYHLSKK